MKNPPVFTLQITAQDTTLPIVDNLDDIASEDSAPQWFQEIQDSTQDAGSNL